MLELNWSDVNRRIYARQIIKSLTYLFLSSKRKSPYYERGDEPLFFGDYDSLSGGRRSRIYENSRCNHFSLVTKQISFEKLLM